MAEPGKAEDTHKNGKKEEPAPQQPQHLEELEAEDLAPDGGWGWVVAAGMTVATLMTVSQGTPFGLIYGEFLEASGNGGSALAILNLMIMISFSMSGLICNELLKRYSIKPVGIIGALIYAVPNTLACFAPNVFFMGVSFFIQGLGIGITMTVCTISFNSYFVKRRTRVLGATQVIIGLGTIVYPLLSEQLLRAYGFRGCVALLGALSFNAVVSMFAMDPVHRHYRDPKIVMAEKRAKKDRRIGSDQIHRNLVIGGGKNGQIRRHSTNETKEWERTKSVKSLTVEAEHGKLLLFDSLQVTQKSQDCDVPGLDVEVGCRSRVGKGSSLDRLANRLSITSATSMTSMNGIGGFNQIPQMKAKDGINEEGKSMLSILGDFFQISLLRDGVYLNLCIGSSVTFITDMLFMGFLPMTMASQGYLKSEIALTLTVVAITELVGKILFMIFAMFFSVKARYIYLGAVYCMVGCRIACFYCNDLISTICVYGFTGIVRSWYGVPQTLVIAEHFKIERFPAAWGLYTVINGLSAVIICPLIGFVKDLTQSYVIMQYVLLGGLLVCLISWTVEVLIHDVFAGRKATGTSDRK